MIIIYIVICILLVFLILFFLKRKLQHSLQGTKGWEELSWKDFFVISFVVCSLYFMGWKPKKDDPWEDW